MARPLAFRFGGAELGVELEKVDRAKLYGYVDVEALDAKGRRCQLVTLAGDGRTLVGLGGTAIGLLSQEGDWLEKAKLSPVDREGKRITPVPSSFSAPVPLERKATVEEYLSHIIKAVYLLRPQGDVAALERELKAGTIYAFPYSFRGGLESDTGFLLAGAEGGLFMAVGQPSKIAFVGLEAAAAVEEEAEEEEEALDFGML